MSSLISPTQSPTILALNNAFAAETSLLTAERLVELLNASSHARCIGAPDAFVIAFRHDDAYDGGHFIWFRTQFDRFLYVDRIVVAAHAQRQGLARRLYDGVFAAASEMGLQRVTCEVNVVPPNPASDAFHAALGFREVGRATFDDDRKSVRYQAAPTAAEPILTSPASASPSPPNTPL